VRSEIHPALLREDAYDVLKQSQRIRKCYSQYKLCQYAYMYAYAYDWGYSEK